MDFNQQLEKLLKTLDKFIDKEGTLLKQNIKDSSEKFDAELIQLLLNNKDTKAHFFNQIGKATVFNYRKFVDYIDDKNFLIDSYTKFSNKVGLTISNKHIGQISDVVLSFPFKDCVLEGGQSKDDKKSKEVFFNEVLAKDEINRLLDKKIITNAKKYTQDGISDEVDFKRDENGLIKDNLIIKGNNLLALHSLKSNFAGKVKLIYIDPPYNTGNDSFNYNDNFNHSTWLVFMKNRLEVARELLSDDGVIFVQCDDNEQAYLKVLMDEVFGRGNFVANFIWKKKGTSTNVKGVQVSQLCELIICYAIKNGIGIYSRITKSEDRVYSYKDKAGSYRLTIIEKKNTGEYKRESMRFEIIGKKPRTGKRWQIGAEKAKKLESMDRFVLDNGIVKQKIYDFEDTDSYSAQPTLLDDMGSTNEGDNEVSKFSFDVEFNNPKPEKLLQKIIHIATKKGDIVLDYHLGSGTTCAVAHKMSRQYIGIEQMDYIEDIAVRRMQKVIGKKVKKDGELLEKLEFDTGGISKSVGWQGGGEFIYFELDKYNQAFIDKLSIATDKTILKLYDQIKEQAFLNFDVEVKKLIQEKGEFKTLNLSEQREFLVSTLNKNQLYKNLSESEDKDLSIDDKTKALNKDFYKE